MYYSDLHFVNELISGSIKLEALSEFCLSGLSSKSRYDISLTVHNTGLTLLQIGQHTKVVGIFESLYFS